MAYSDWTTISSHKMMLYKTDNTENFEFDISAQFQNPGFMVFFNAIRYNGNISGFAPYVQNITGNKYKVIPRIRTTSRFNVSGSISNSSYEYGRVPYTRRIFIAGFLYPTSSIALNKKPVNIYTEADTFNSVNLSGGQPMNSWFWAYTVPSAYYKSGIKITIQTTGYDLWAASWETDANYKLVNGVPTASGFNYVNLSAAECTILVVEKGLQG